MIQDHVVSLELSKQLYEAGIKIKSEFWWVEWVKFPNGERYEPIEPELLAKDSYRLRGNFNSLKYPASLSSELGELLPNWIKDGKWQLVITKASLHKGMWRLVYENRDRVIPEPEIIIEDVTEANARAKMLLYLKEKGLI